MAEPRLQPVPRQLRARPARPRTTAATRSGPCTTSTPRSAARYGPWSSLDAVRRGGPGPELRDPARRVRGLHRPLDATRTRLRPGSSTGSSTRAGRRCCGISTTTTSTRPAATSAPRRPTSRCTSCTPTTPGRCRSTTSRGWTAARAVGRVEGLRRRRHSCSTTRPRTGSRSAARESRRTSCIPSCPPRRSRRRRRRPTSSSCCSRAHGHGRRPQRLLALDPAGRRRLGHDDRQPAGDDDPVREPHAAAVAGRRHRPRDRRHPAASVAPAAATPRPT